MHEKCVTKEKGFSRIQGKRKAEVNRMFIIAGLGNPDEKYQGTRHNVGFDVVDRLAEKYQIAVDTKNTVPSSEKE